MLHPIIILLIAAIFIDDAFGGARSPLRIAGFTPGQVAAITLGGQAGIAAGAHVMVGFFRRRLDRRGSLRDASRAETSLLIARAVSAALHTAAVLMLGWLGVVRAWVGDVVFVDEALATLPPLIVFAAGWWSFYPIERRLRDAMTIRTLDFGGRVYPMPTRRQFVIDKARHQALIVLVPISLVLAWSEAAALLAQRLAPAIPWLADPHWGGVALATMQLIGVGVIFLFTPPMVRVIWDTVPLGPGALRERLLDLCARHAVKVRRMLVWRTHGVMINGAVLGLIGPLRYILLTDALLDHLPAEQVEAVMAHEVGHVRRRHLPWLIVTLMAGMGVGLLVVSAPLSALMVLTGIPHGSALGAWIEALSAFGSIGLALVLFGFVSRRFERQADAFAVQHMSGLTRANSGRSLTVTPEAADAMAGALQSVAELNHVPRRRFTWRHGSIADRQRAIGRLIGRPVDRLPIDRTIRWIKALAFVVLCGSIALAAWADLNADASAKAARPLGGHAEGAAAGMAEPGE